MKKYAYILVISFLAFSCTPPDDNGPAGNDDTSPGVDEYFRVDINGSPWEVEDDEYLGAVYANFGSGPKYVLAGTRMADSTNFNYGLPYFYGADTTFTFPDGPGGANLAFFLDNAFLDGPSGSFHISKSVVDDMEIFTGTFSYEGTEPVSDTPASFTNGEFVIARIL